MDSNGSPASYDAESFARIAEELQTAGDPQETAEQVVATAVGTLEADHASITMIRRRGGFRLNTIAATDPMIVQLDLQQQELREGPCFDESWRGSTLLASALRSDPRWPRWAPKAAASGVVGMMAVELVAPERRVGTLNLYYIRPRQFSADDIAFANIFGRHASVAVASEATRSELIVALDSRKLIGQAQGILMERYNLSEAQAFEVLKRYSTDNNVKLRDVAERLRTTRRLPDTPGRGS